MKLDDIIIEADVSAKNIDIAIPKIEKYLENALGVTLVKVPGVEHFSNSNGSGYGIRYVIEGTLRCIRINWATENTGSSANIHSIDVFNGKTAGPNWTVSTNGISFAQALPTVAEILKAPEQDVYHVFPVNPNAAMNEELVVEAAKEDFTASEALDAFLKAMASGKTFTRSDFIAAYHNVNVGAFDTAFNDFKDRFVVMNNKRLTLPKDANINQLKTDIMKKAGIVHVKKADGKEEQLRLQQEEELIKKNKHKVSFETTLKDLDDLVLSLIKGASNSLIIFGRSGTGKTENVEKALHDNGLTEGKDYIKISGAASAAGIFLEMYHHRHDIIVFDDCDSALGEQDARNVIKAATDTKKNRVIHWTKKSPFVFDAERIDPEVYADERDKAPNRFTFTGRVIFISNLTIDRLDPDGAVRTRAMVINVNPNDAEIVKYMETILMNIKLPDGLNLNAEARKEVFDIVKRGVSAQTRELSIRKLVHALNIRATGLSNWKELILRYE